jgi:hypothetical protein
VIWALETLGEPPPRGPTQPTEVVLNVSAAHIDAQGWRHA